MKNNLEKINIAFCINESYAEHLNTVIYSISENNKNVDIDIYIIYYQLSAEKKNYILSLVDKLANINVYFKKVLLEQLPSIKEGANKLPIESYFRMLLADLVDVDRILYLDVDVLVIGNLYELYNTNLVDKYVAVVAEPNVKIEDSVRYDILGLKENNEYFNSGVMLMNLELFRRDDITKKLITFSEENYMKVQWGDQDLLNMFFKDSAVFIDSSYNYSHDFLMRDTYNYDNKVILHYNSNQISKPWDNVIGSRSYGQKAIIEYQKYTTNMLDLFAKQLEKISIVILVDEMNPTYLLRSLDSACLQQYNNKEIIVLSIIKNNKLRKIISLFDDFNINYYELENDNYLHSEILKYVSNDSDYMLFINSSDFITNKKYLNELVRNNNEQADIILPNCTTLEEKQAVYYYYGNLAIDENDNLELDVIKNLQMDNRAETTRFRTLYGNLIRTALFRKLNKRYFNFDSEKILSDLLVISNKNIVVENNNYCFTVNDSRTLPTFDSVNNKFLGKISIVVFAGDGKHLDECLISLKNQTYRNLDIIVILNDKKEINLDLSDNRIRVVDTKKIFLDRIILGRAVIFLESDDKLNEDFVEVMYSNFNKYNSKVVVSNIYEYNEYDGMFYYHFVESENKVDILTKSKAIQRANYLGGDYVSFKRLTGKLIDVELLENVSEEGNIVDIYHASDNVVFVNENICMYRVRKE